MKKISSLSSTGSISNNVDVDFFFKSDVFFHEQSVFDAVNTEQQNQRQASAHTKTKAEVSGTGKKPYRQKHTGRARQGSRRNPQFVGGGCAFGPKNERNFKIKMNKKVSSLAFFSAWQHVLSSSNVAILDSNFCKENDKPSTKKMFEILKKSQLTDKKKLLVLSENEKSLYLSFRNIENVIIKVTKKLSVRDLLNQNFLLISDSAWKNISEQLKQWI